MLLAASDESHENVEPLAPAPGTPPGARMWFGDNGPEQVGCYSLCLRVGGGDGGGGRGGGGD
jgi:hypothetical protein